jgi:ABC-type glycerol-3-phosphate transport system permease component
MAETRTIANPALPIAAPHRRRRKFTVSLGLVYVFLAVTALFCFIPLLWVATSSVDPAAGVHLQLPASIDLSNYTRFLSDPQFSRYVVNSLLMAGGATAVTISSAVLGGYALSRFAFRGRRTLMFAIILTRIIPVSATIAPLYVIVQRLGLVDTYQGLIFVLAAQQLPLALWLMKGFFDTVPAELEEAAWIDGTGRLGSALRIVLPLAAPGVGAAALFAFIEAWGDFLTPFILVTSPDRFPLSVGLFVAYKAHNLVDWGLLTATSVIYMLPTVVLYLLVRRYLLRATAVGALQGQ